MEEKKIIEPDPDVKDRLMKAFDEKYPLPRESCSFSFFRLMTYPIPLYQAGLAASILLSFMFYLLLQDYRTPGEVAVADTVYIDKPVQIRDTMWLEKPGSKESGRKTDRHTREQFRSAQTFPVLAENDLYSRQMKEAMNRVSVISALGRERSVTRDRELLKLVSFVY